ncbi:MAG: valine--pyruvate transaminase [Spirochaetales bacterium]|nr:valine--pyruvate transaminase [Spirochaetales bacterium]
MAVSFSKIGQKLTTRSGILELMDDLGSAMTTDRPLNMLGGGNPAHIPACNELWRRRMEEILSNGAEFERMVANYDTPQGNDDFLKSIAAYLKAEYSWDVGPENIAVTNGSQSAFFYLFNLLSGEMPDGRVRKILFPLVPEYIGYADQGLHPQSYESVPAAIEERGAHRFKYHINFDALSIGTDIGALCVSRPTNPTGNVITDGEVMRLSAMAKAAGVPLLIDNAYGAPFPNILFADTHLHWEDHIILGMSLSKIGLPSVRTGVILASPEIVQAVSAVNAIVSLSNSTLGQVITAPLIADGTLRRLSTETIMPFYRERSRKAMEWLDAALADVPYRIHESEGALFLWVWFPGLPVSSMELYRRLKERDTLVIPGEYFFFGSGTFAGNHSRECIRLTYSQDEDSVREGIRIIGEEVRNLYS